MNGEFFKSNRQKIANEIANNSLVVLFAGNAPKKTADEKYQFTPNRNFYYLTGVNEENHILVISKFKNEVKSYLFIKEVDEVKEKWEGRSIRKDEVIDVSGVHEVKYLNELNRFIHKTISVSEEINVYFDLERDDYDSIGSISENISHEILNKYPQVKIKNINKLIGKFRLIKTKDEIDEMRKAIKITIDGVELLLENAKVGMKEYELESYFDFKCKTNGVKDFAFKTIAAGGKNATVLHYVDNDSTLKDGDLILFDLGAQYNYYNADISRTFPVNGKFTGRQKEVYNAVLRVNEKIISEMKPGIKFIDLNKKARDLIAEECINLGLIKNKDDVGKYYYHSIGHSLGLDTHDVELENRDVTFEAGMVYTVEPGIYIEDEEIGIRIEDDVLITENGHEILTKEMIKSVEDIEKFMGNRINN